METRPTTDHTSNSRRGELVVGLVLIAAGLFYLLANFFNLGALVLPVLGAGFLLLGIITRQAGWFIPGGILGGISLGIYLVEGPFQLAGEQNEGALFMLAFALGWFSITLFSRLLTSEPQWWALIPGAIMALIGFAVLGIGTAERLLSLVGTLWPLALVAAGIYVLIEWKRKTG